MSYWLVKTDPDTYAWDDFEKEKKTSWDGIRNYAARNHLKAMKKNDKVLVYHSGGESEIRGTAIVSKEFYQDPTTNETAWCSVELTASQKLMKAISLSEIKLNKSLKNMMLLKISRLSVMPVTKEEYETILELSGSKK